MILRAKTDSLIKTRELSVVQQANTKKNHEEIQLSKVFLASKPQRLVFELTNSCNLNCVMCGRNARHFKPMYFNTEWLSKFDTIALHVEEVTLMGWGEPTMHPQFVDFLIWAQGHGLRKYFCTNGIKLGSLQNHIFEQQVDVIAISIDAADNAANRAIRRGADLDAIVESLKNIVEEKRRRKSPYPYMNFVTTLMKRNLKEFPKIVKLAADIGLNEAKAVFLTAFDETFVSESLYDAMDEVKAVFDDAQEIAEKYGIDIKLPALRGEDPAGDAPHKPCWTAWRDFFLGSDGYVRPCMSSPLKFFHIDDYTHFEEMWNSESLVNFRNTVNRENSMPDACKNCYQSSFANWNKKESFYQIGKTFSPVWG
jgi:radical SAM protein with 4Fe4S-binding SPASM domain